MKEVKFKIESTTALLMHNVNSMLLEKPQTVTHAEWEKSQEVFKSRMYIKGDKLEIPSRVWKAILVEGAKKCGIKQKGKRSTYADIIKATVFMPEGMALDQNMKDVVKEQGFVSIQNSKVLRIWPKLDTWSGTLNLTLADERQMGVATLEEILKFAGLFVGAGDYRPEFGRFTIAKL